MSGESYTRWRSEPSDDDDDDNEEAQVNKETRERSSVTVIPPSARPMNGIKDLGHLRILCVLVLICAICTCIGGLIGYSIGSKQESVILQDVPPNVNFTYKGYGSDEFFGKSIQMFRNHLQPQVIEKYAKEIAKTPKEDLPNYIEEKWRLLGLETSTTSFIVDLSQPERENPNTVALMYPSDNEQIFNELPKGDETPPFLAYSPSGTVSGPVVYGHYGRREDLQTVQSLKVSINGSILLLRHGKLHLGSKLHNAEQAGAIGVLFYPDPKDFRGKRSGGMPYPNGTGLPDDGIIWKTLSTLPGDPATPFLPSLDNIYRSSRTAEQHPGIPAHTISAKSAARIMNLMNGPKVPKNWNGNLSLSLEYARDNILEYNLGGSWSQNIKNLTLTVNNKIHQERIKNIHASFPSMDDTRVIMIGCHYGALNKESGVGLASLLALSESLLKAFSQNGTQRKIIFSAWAASQQGMIGSTEFTQLFSHWLDKKVMGYLSLDEVLVGKGTLRVMASPTLRKSIREAAKLVDWADQPKVGRTMNVRDGWRLSDPLKNNDVHISSPGSGSDFVSFTSQNGIPSAHFVALGKNWARTYSLQHSQYDTLKAFTEVLDPDYQWTHMISSLVGAVAIVLSEKELPPVVFSEMSGDLYNGWRRFLDLHNTAFNNSGYDFEGILNAIDKEIEILDSHLEILNEWYDDVALMENKIFIDDHNNRFFSAEHHREVEERLQQMMMLERGFMGPRGVGRSYTTNVMIGPDPEDPESPIHYPHATRAITLALQHKIPWNSVHQELSYVLATLTSYKDFLKSNKGESEWFPS